MKKLLALLLAMVMVVSMAACGTTEDLDDLNDALDQAAVELDEIADELDEEVVEEEVEEAEVVASYWLLTSVETVEGTVMNFDQLVEAGIPVSTITFADDAVLLTAGEDSHEGAVVEAGETSLTVEVDGEAQVFEVLDETTMYTDDGTGNMMFYTMSDLETLQGLLSPAAAEATADQDSIVNWEVVAAVSPEGEEVSAEEMGMTMVYGFNETLLEVAAYMNGEVATVGTYVEAGDYLEITLDGEMAYGYMEGEYFVIEGPDGTLQYCAQLEG